MQIYGLIHINFYIMIWMGNLNGYLDSSFMLYMEIAKVVYIYVL